MLYQDFCKWLPGSPDSLLGMRLAKLACAQKVHFQIATQRVGIQQQLLRVHIYLYNLSFLHFQIRAEVEADKDQEKKRAVNVATRSLERDLERLKADHATEVEQLNEKHKQEMGELKKKQWVRFVLKKYNQFVFVGICNLWGKSEALK